MLLLPLFGVWRSWRVSSRSKIKFPFYSPLHGVWRSSDRFWIKLHELLPFFIIILFIVALARPQWGNKETEISSEGVDIVLVLDTSGSMAGMDFRLNGEMVNRLTVVKKVVTEFIQQQQSNRIGMIIFGDKAYTQCPLTLDYDVLIQFLDHISIGIAGDATAIGDGLALAVKRLKDLPSKSKVVVLLTDGRNNAGTIAPEKAAEIAKSFGIRVYTIGIGTKGPVPFPQRGFFGTQLVYVDLDMDEETLRKIAEVTSGKYYFATDSEKLREIYQEIAKLEKTIVKVKHYEHYDEWFPYLLFPALGLLLLEILLGATLLRRLE